MSDNSRMPDYNLNNLQVVIPWNRDFRMFITPRFFSHYVDNPYEEYTSDLLLRYVTDGSTFIDIGAHYGYYTLLIGSQKPNCRIMAFEPVPENFEILKKNVQLNNLENVTTRQAAVSDKSGMQKFQIMDASDNCGFHGHPLSGKIKEIEVESIVLDDVLKDLHDKEVTIKIDTEGHDLFVLEGMKDFLAQNDNVKLVIEFNPKCIANAGYAPEDLLHKIIDLDFDVYFILDDKRLFYKLDPAKVEKWPYYMQGYETSYLNILCVKKARALGVCFFSHSSNLMGAERSMLELVKELIEDHGALVTVCVPFGGPLKDKLNELGAAVIPVDYTWWCDWSARDNQEADAQLVNGYFTTLQLLSNTLKNVNPDVIVTNTLVIPWGAITAALIDKPHAWFIREFGELDYAFKFYRPFQEIIKKAL